MGAVEGADRVGWHCAVVAAAAVAAAAGVAVVVVVRGRGGGSEDDVADSWEGRMLLVGVSVSG